MHKTQQPQRKGDSLTAKEYLKQSRTMKYQIRAKKRELENLHDDAETLKGNIIKEKVQTTPRCNNFDFENIDELEKLIQGETSDKLAFNLKLHKMFAKIKNGLYNAILTDYYINEMPYKEIALDLRYSYDYVKALGSEALEEFIRIHGDIF